MLGGEKISTIVRGSPTLTSFLHLLTPFSSLPRFSFLKRNQKKKIIVFFSSCNCVKYHAELLNYIDLPVLELHGKQKQQKRTNTFFEFCNASQGTLICTDVAARGLDVSFSSRPFEVPTNHILLDSCGGLDYPIRPPG